MNKLSINRVSDSNIYFTYSEKSLITLQLRVNGSIQYVTELSVSPGFEYYIGHPSLVLFEEAVLEVSTDTTSQFFPIKDLFSKPEHIINLIGKDTYKEFQPWLNASYWETFVANSPGYIVDRLKNCKIVVDLGSNIGIFTKFLFQQSIPDLYICVEPSIESNKANYILNKEQFDLDRIKIYPNLFSDTDDDLVNFYYSNNLENSPGDTMFPDELNFFYKKEPENFSISSVSTITLQKIIDENKIDVIDYLKVDIEGAEKFLLSPINYDLIKAKVKYFMAEVHTDELREDFKRIFNQDGFVIEKIHGLHYHIINTNILRDELINAFGKTLPNYQAYVAQSGKAATFQNVMGKVLVKVACPALGDTLCSTPTIRAISKAYGHPISVQTHRRDLFERNPYVDEIYDFSLTLDGRFTEVFETYNQWIKTNRHMNKDDWNEKTMEIKLHTFEARQLHAMGVGLTLYPPDLTCEFYPDKQTDLSKKIDQNWIVFHTTKSWECRTWPDEYWDRLTNLIKQHTNLKIVTIGKSHKEGDYFSDLQKNVLRLNGVDMDLCVDGAKYQNEFDPGSISEMWHVINNALALVSFDSGPVHLAGTTDTHIIQIGSSITPYKTAPWRQGKQDYKFHFIGGNCTLFCASDPKYSVKEWGTINSIPYVPLCQEKYDTFRCQPTPDAVFAKIIELLAL